MTTPGRALVLVGHGRYEDQWHDVAATAQFVCGALVESGVVPLARGTFAGVLDDGAWVDQPPALIAVLAGDGRPDAEFDGSDADWTGFHAGLASLVGTGVPLLALHASANTFHDAPSWPELLGGRWVPDRSGHPPIGPATFDVVDVGHPITVGLTAVEAFDERYTDLDVHPGSRVLVSHEHEGRRHAVVWVGPGPSRVVYDGLGHDVRSYESPSRRALLRREVHWLLDAPAES